MTVPIIFWNLSSALILTLTIWAVIYGTALRRSFQSDSECDMSWSAYQFIPIHLGGTNVSAFGPHYQVYKFVDARDPRHSHFFHTQKSPLKILRGPKACPSATNSASQHLVLFVPGYGGVYQQARSLGAHGIQLANETTLKYEEQRIIQGLAKGDLHSAALDLNNFIFDVYAVEFKNYLPLHSFPFYTQAEYLAHVLITLPKQCPHLTDITIVAHSMGGLVSRKAMILLQQHLTRMKMNSNTPRLNLITLATPHKLMPFSFEHTMYQLYQRLRHEEVHIIDESLIRLSISGGFRDELIAPELSIWNMPKITTNVDKKHATFNLFASQIMMPSTNTMDCTGNVDLSLGIDHKAIVWCWNLLYSIRHIIHTVIVEPQIDRSAKTPMSRTLDQISRVHSNRNHCSIHETHPSEILLEQNIWKILDIQRQSLVATFGQVSSILLESTMLYNYQILVVLYSLNSLFFLYMMHLYQHVLRPSTSSCIRLEAFVCWIYAVGPFLVAVTTSYFLKRFLLYIIHVPSSTIYFILPSYMSMSLYFILFGILWAMATWLSKLDCFRISMDHTLTRSTKCYSKMFELMRRYKPIRVIQINTCVFLTMGIIVWMAYKMPASTNILSCNFTALQSYIFLGWSMSVVQHLIYFGFQLELVGPDIQKLFPNPNRIGKMALLFPVFIIVSAGKMYLAFCLLTVDGQRDAQYYLQATLGSTALSSWIPQWWLHLLPSSLMFEFIQFSCCVTTPMLLYLLEGT